MRKISDTSNFDSIDLLRFPLVVLVVFIHVIPPQLHTLWPFAGENYIYILTTELISHHIGRVVVPCFFLFSGYFFFLKVEKLNLLIYGMQLQKRLKTILIPYLLWNVLFIMISLLKNYFFSHLGLDQDEMMRRVYQESFYDLFWKNPFDYPMWYLRDLICMSLLSPGFYLLFNYLKWLGPILLIGLYLMVWELNIPGLSTTAFTFFGIGAFCGLKKYDITVWGRDYKYYKFSLSLIFLMLSAYFANLPSYESWIRIFILTGIISTLCLGDLLLKLGNLKYWLTVLSSSVFFIYAIHEIYIINWLKGAFFNFSNSAGFVGKLLIYFSIPVLCLIICLGLYKLMKLISIPLLEVLTGGRITTKSIKKYE